jgi:hypothetical protein
MEQMELNPGVTEGVVEKVGLGVVIGELVTLVVIKPSIGVEHQMVFLGKNVVLTVVLKYHY